jgi:hypothetical protein
MVGVRSLTRLPRGQRISWDLTFPQEVIEIGMLQPAQTRRS